MTMERASYSRVNSILNCPKKYNEVAFESSVPFQTGLIMHQLLENYIKHGVIDPVVHSYMDEDFIPLAVEVMGLEGHERLISEYEIMTDDFKGYIDLVIIDDKQKTVVIADLKTVSMSRAGSYKLTDAEQMRLYAYYFDEINQQFGDAGYTFHIAYLIYRKNFKETPSNPKKMTFDVLELTGEEMDDTKNNFDIKTKMARHILATESYYAHKNEYCNFCSIKDKCGGLK